MAAREHEAVAVGPGGIGRVVAEEVLPDGVRDRGERHRGAGMAALGSFDRVHRQGADGVNREAVDVGGHGRVLEGLGLRGEKFRILREVASTSQVAAVFVVKLRVGAAAERRE